MGNKLARQPLVSLFVVIPAEAGTHDLGIQ